MLINKLQEFYNMSDTELANYYVDLCAYDDNKAIEERRKVVIIICDRFVDKFSDYGCNEECEDFHLTDI